MVEVTLKIDDPVPCTHLLFFYIGTQIVKIRTSLLSQEGVWENSISMMLFMSPRCVVLHACMACLQYYAYCTDGSVYKSGYRLESPNESTK